MAVEKEFKTKEIRRRAVVVKISGNMGEVILELVEQSHVRC